VHIDGTPEGQTPLFTTFPLIPTPSHMFLCSEINSFCYLSQQRLRRRSLHQRGAASGRRRAVRYIASSHQPRRGVQWCGEWRQGQRNGLRIFIPNHPGQPKALPNLACPEHDTACQIWHVLSMTRHVRPCWHEVPSSPFCMSSTVRQLK
jgi:hypothetical protein